MLPRQYSFIGRVNGNFIVYHIEYCNPSGPECIFFVNGELKI